MIRYFRLLKKDPLRKLAFALDILLAEGLGFQCLGWALVGGQQFDLAVIFFLCAVFCLGCFRREYPQFQAIRQTVQAHHEKIVLLRAEADRLYTLWRASQKERGLEVPPDPRFN